MPADTLTPPAPPAAPAAPAPSPAPAPAPSPTPAPSPAPVENPYADIDAAVARVDAAPPSTHGKPPPPKAGTPPKPAAPAKSDASTPPKPAVVPKELRAELDRVKGELKAKSDAATALEAKIADFEKKGKDTEVLASRLATLEKDIETLRAENRALKQETSPEFKKKYDEPFNRLADRAKLVVEKIPVTDEAGNTRAATWEEFSRLYKSDEFSATREAKQLFGEDGAMVVMRYYHELHRLDDDRIVALNEEKSQWKQKEEAEKARQLQDREEISRVWKQTNAQLAESVDDYHDSPDDKELSEARQKALAIFDTPAKTFKEKIVKDAHNRQRVAAFVPMKIKIARLTKERDDLKAELEGLKEKPPGKTGRAGGAPAAAPSEDFETGLRKAMEGVS